MITSDRTMRLGVTTVFLAAIISGINVAAEEEDGKVKSFYEHTATVKSVVFSPDAARVASFSIDGEIMVWEVESGKRIRTIRVGTERCRAITLSPDSKHVLCARGKQLELWNVRSEKNVRRFEAHEGTIVSVAFDSTGRMAVSGGQLKEPLSNAVAQSSNDESPSGEVILWDVSSGELIRRFGSGQHKSSCVRISPDGKLIASAGFEKDENGEARFRVHVWDMETGKHEKTLNHASLIGVIAFSPDSRFILSGCLDRKIRLWDLKSGQNLRRFRWHRSDGAVHSVAFSPDGKLVLSADALGIDLWDVATGWHVQGYRAWSPITAIGVSAVGPSVITGTSDGEVELWRLPDADHMARYCNEAFDFRLKVARRFDDWQEALVPLQVIDRLKPDFAESRYDRGLVHGYCNQKMEAIAAYQEALRLNPNHVMSHNNLAWILATSRQAAFRDGKKAVEHATRACELTDWKNPWYLDTLAAAYAEVGAYQSAVDWQEKAVASASSFSEEELPLVRKRLALYRGRQPYREHGAVEVRVTNDTNESVRLRVRHWIDENGVKRPGRFQELGPKESSTVKYEGEPIRAIEFDYTVGNRWGTHEFLIRNSRHGEELSVTIRRDDVTNTKQIGKLLRYLSDDTKFVLCYDVKRFRVSNFAKEALPDADEFNEHSAFTIDDDTVELYESTDFIVTGVPALATNVKELDVSEWLFVAQGGFEDYEISDWASMASDMEFVEGTPIFTYPVDLKIPHPMFDFELRELHIAPLGGNIVLMGLGKDGIKRALANEPSELTPAMREFLEQAVSQYVVAARAWGTGYLASQIPEFDESDFEHITIGVSADDHLSLAFSFEDKSVREAVRGERNLRAAYDELVTFTKLFLKDPLAREPLETFETTREGTSVTATIRISKFVAEALWEGGYVDFLDEEGKEVEERRHAKSIKIWKAVGFGKNPHRGFRFYVDKNGDLSASRYGISKEVDLLGYTTCFDNNGVVVDTVTVIRPGGHEAAERVGFVGGDVLIRRNGEEVQSYAHVLYEAATAGDDVWTVEVIRDGNIAVLKGNASDIAKVLLLHADNALADRTGARIQLVIPKVVEDSIGQELGIQAGDVILEYDGEKCRGATWFKMKRSKEQEDDEKKELLIDRSGKPLRFQVPANVTIGIHLENVVIARQP